MHELSNSQLNKVKAETKNNTEVTFENFIKCC